MDTVRDKTYFPKLDVLRFFAFLLVFTHHMPVISKHPLWLGLHKSGWLGVDLFLCLSAFLFTKLLYTEYQRTGTINIRYFYVRRTLRIWPLYYFFIIAMMVVGYFNKYNFETLYLRIIGVVTFTDNFVTAYSTKYNPFPYVAHLWTIAYEEQFYAIIPWPEKGSIQIIGDVALIKFGSYSDTQRRTICFSIENQGRNEHRKFCR